MTDESELIRTQMDDTRSDLSEKLESLENRVSETVQMTGTAVSDTVTGIRDAAHSLSEVLDIRLQVRRHPWIAFGGSVALGYLAARLSERPAQRSNPIAITHEVASEQCPVLHDRPVVNEPGTIRHPPLAAPPQSVLWGTLMAVVVDLTVRSIPVVLDYVRQQRPMVPPQPFTDPTRVTLPLSSKAATGASGRLTRHVM